MRNFVRLSILFSPAVIQHLELKTAPTAIVWRLQGVVILMTAVLLFLLPLALPARVALYGLLSVIAVGLILRSREERDFKSLTIDTDAQTVSIEHSLSGSGSESRQDLDQNQQEGAMAAKQLSCRVEYFSQRLVMLAYREPADDDFRCRYLRRFRRFPVFPPMLGDDDYRRLLAVARLVQTR